MLDSYGILKILQMNLKQKYFSEYLIQELNAR